MWSVHWMWWVRRSLLCMMLYLLGGRNSGGSGDSSSGRCRVGSPCAVVVRKLHIIKGIFLKA